jgi:hypothetical protein
LKKNVLFSLIAKPEGPLFDIEQFHFSYELLIGIILLLEDRINLALSFSLTVYLHDRHVFHFSVVLFIWSFRIIDSNTFKCWKLSTTQAGVRDLALIHYPSCTDSIKPSLQFSRNFVVINASEGSHFLQNE